MPVIEILFLQTALNIFVKAFFSNINGIILNFKVKKWRVFRLISSKLVAEIFDFSYFNSSSNKYWSAGSNIVNVFWISSEIHNYP